MEMFGKIQANLERFLLTKITPSFPGVDFQGRTFKAVSFREGIFFSEPQHNKIN